MNFLSAPIKDGTTGTVIVLTTPDAQRTMLAYQVSVLFTILYCMQSKLILYLVYELMSANTSFMVPESCFVRVSRFLDWIM